MGLPTEVLQAWEACDRTDTLFVLVCSVFCTYMFHYCLLNRLTLSRLGYHPSCGYRLFWLHHTVQLPSSSHASHLNSDCLLDTVVSHRIHINIRRGRSNLRRFQVRFPQERASRACWYHTSRVVQLLPASLPGNCLRYCGRWCLRARENTAVDTLHICEFT
jgi:hypothetical protein